MGNLCSKRKNSDSISIKSEGKRDSLDTQENHSQSSKRPSQQNGANQDGGGAGDGLGDASGPGGIGPHGSNLQRDVLRSRLKNVEPSSVSGDSMSLSSPTAPVAPAGLARGGADGKDPFALPQEIRKQSDNVKNLLFGRVGKIKGIEKRRKITLYISAPSSTTSSSTSFSQDFHHEKEQLRSRVYEPLRDFCSSRGYELHMVDLHWNNDALILEEMQGGDLLHLSLHQLSRQLEVSHVVPVILLSNNLGPSILPKSVEQQDFESSLKSLNNESAKKNLVSSWYTLDSENQPACYRLKPISANIPTILSNKEEGMKEWHQVEQDLLNALLQMFSPERRDVYLSSIIEQEIRNIVFASREQAKRSIWIQRVFTHIQAPTDQQVTPLEEEQNRRLESLHTELKNQLSTEHIMRLLVKWQDGGLAPAQHPEHSQYLDGLTSQLTNKLQTTISQIIDDEDENATWKSFYGLDGSLCSELMLHTLVCQQTTKCPPGVETVLSRIKSYIETMEIKHPLVLTGGKGCGKTSILSVAIQHCSHWFPDALILFRFVGLTSESRSLVQIFRTLTSQLAYLLTGRNYWIPHKLECYQGELYKLLSSMTSPPLVVVLIDGLDELNPYEAGSLDWLSEALPSRLRLIISTAWDGSSSSVFQSVQANIRQDDAFLTIPPLSQPGAESLLTEFIVKGGQNAGTAAGSDKAEVQKKLFPALKNSTLPLYIKVLAWLASVDRALDVSGIKDLNSAISALFDQLENMMGKDKVGKSLQLLCTARYGLQDSELLDLLSNLPNFTGNNLPTWAVSSIFLARLRSVLDVFLSWGVAGNAVVTRFKDATIFEAAKARYVASSTTEGSKILLKYFQESSKMEGENSGPNYACNRHRRRLEEVPVHHLAVHGSIRNDFLCNVDWLIQKLCSSSVYYVLEDMILETKGDFSNDPDLSLLYKTLQLSASALSYDGRQFFGQIFGRLQSIYGPTPCEKSVSSEWGSGKCVFMEKLYEMSQKPCVPSFLPISPFLNGPAGQYDGTIDYEKSDSGEVYFNEIMRMKVSNQYVVSLATAREEVTVWDVYAEKPVRELKGVMSPNNLKIIDEHRCVILCGRELHIFNLDDGTFVTKLKGVMNQKMPFFGLHDSNHIVALSRNRMYVNLMNLESGDCVTTFKVGEDRFLNSLIVSDNGKILVCGDETQKPFPLLVWDLTSRKLLYDLRIPHHEFITSLSAITKEGHFVCCVCREVDDPGPNFIVVYDLQSGTLFKKWKPGCNTQAIAISAQGGCVINAVDDNRVLVWDLVTGACQWSLQKHNAPVDILRLDQKGSRCLSCDSTGRDRTVCLWDLTTGTLLALFTPDISFTASEVTNDGEGVILGLKGRKNIVTLLYRDNVSVYSNRVDEKFGADANQGKVTDLKSP